VDQKYYIFVTDMCASAHPEIRLPPKFQGILDIFLVLLCANMDLILSVQLFF